MSVVVKVVVVVVVGVEVEVEMKELLLGDGVKLAAAGPIPD